MTRSIGLAGFFRFGEGLVSHLAVSSSIYAHPSYFDAIRYNGPNLVQEVLCEKCYWLYLVNFSCVSCVYECPLVLQDTLDDELMKTAHAIPIRPL